MPDETEKTTPTEDDIAKLIADSNPAFPLTRANALTALTPPEGTVFERVAGRNMASRGYFVNRQGADIIFRYKDGTQFLREIKCIVGGRNSFNRDLQKAVRQLGVPNPIGDVFIQVPICYPLKEGLQTFLFYRKQEPGALEKYRGIRLQVQDETGCILYDAQILDALLDALKEGEQQCDR